MKMIKKGTMEINISWKLVHKVALMTYVVFALSVFLISITSGPVRAMGGALKLGKNLHDNGFGMFRTMLAYKLEQKGSCLVKVDR